MNNTPLVSIAVCVYNGAKYLEQQLDTLVKQTYTNLEIVIVDDASADSSPCIIDKYISDPRIKLYKNEKNLGYVKNLRKRWLVVPAILLRLQTRTIFGI